MSVDLGVPGLMMIRIVVIAAHGLAKPDDLSLPDPFAVIIVDSVQTHTTSVIKQTLHPYWNEHFDVMVKRSSVVTVQIFDQRKLVQLERDQGFSLGFIKVHVTDYLDLELGGQVVLLDLKGTVENPVVQGKLIFHLSINLTTSATSFRPNDPSLALTSLPLNDCSLSVNNYSVNNYSINNCSIDSSSIDSSLINDYSTNDYSMGGLSIDDDSINNCSIDDYSINNAPANTAPINSASSELYAQSISLSSRTTSPEVTTPIMAMPTTIIPGTDTDIVANSSTDPETSSLTRRNNALAQALFGASDSDEILTSPSPLSTDEPDGTSNSTRREDVFARALFGASDSDERPPPTRSRMRGGHRDARVDLPRSPSPAWSFRSRSGSATSHDGGLFSGKFRFGSRRSAKTSNATSASAIEVHSQHQALTSSSSLPTDEPKETSGARRRKNAFAQAFFGDSDSDEPHYDDPPPTRPRMRDGHRDARVDPPRSSSPAWSFRSRSGSTTSHDGGLFSGKFRFGSRRSAKTSNASSASAIEVHSQHQALTSSSSLPTDEPKETASARRRKNAIARALFGDSDSDEPHYDGPPPTSSRMRDGHRDARVDPPRSSSPAWSFRSRSGSTTSHDGGLFSGKLRFGSRRSAKTSNATSASAMEMHGQHQSLISPSSLSTDEPKMDTSQQITQSAPPDNKSFHSDTVASPESSPMHKLPPSVPSLPSSVPDASAAGAVLDEGALTRKRFIDAANSLGLDQDAITALLAHHSAVSQRG